MLGFDKQGVALICQPNDNVPFQQLSWLYSMKCSSNTYFQIFDVIFMKPLMLYAHHPFE